MNAFRIFLICSAVAVAGASTADAQFGRRRGWGGPSANVSYGSQFTFVRLQYTMGMGRRGRGEPPWAHDYPRAERNFAKILTEVSYIEPYMGGSNILTLGDPELFKYPVAYMSEPGFWTMSPAEVRNLRAYILKGGFLIFDDFANTDWYNFEEQMRVLLPESQLVRLDESHPIFDSFFRIQTLDFDHPYYGVKAEFYGVFEDNDPEKRLLAIANYNNDIGDYWEFSDTGWLPIDLSNQAYKLGVNYLIYAMTH